MTDFAVPSAEVPVIEKNILLVEDELVFAKAVKKHLQKAGFITELAQDLKSAQERLSSNMPNLILLDMRLPDGSGLDFLSTVRNRHESRVPVLVMSAYGELEDAVSAMKLGASDYLKKPIDLDELLVTVQKVFDKDELFKKLEYSAKREQHAAGPEVDFLGECAAIKSVREQVSRIAKLAQTAETIPPTVLILGETGTGKDIVARLLHAHSLRSRKPFVHVDCASLPKDLIESELFGHEKGAFTHAHAARAGLIEAAENGLLFLDEIGELPLDVQSKLLAVLERRILRRVGATQEKPVAAWIIAATNRDLNTLAANGQFRSDLYYRLNVLTIQMPALRERGSDIVVLAEYFAAQTAKRYGLPNPTFNPDTAQCLAEYPWQGNARELKHVIERAVLLSGGSEIDAATLSLDNKPAEKISAAEQPDEITLTQAEKNIIKQALDKTNRNVSKAARELGITRMALRYRIKKYDL